MLMDTLSAVIHWILNSIGISLNLLLVYLVIYKSPKSIKRYSLLILNFAITDLTSCLLDLFIQDRTISNGIFIALVSNGLCTRFGSKACEIGYTFILHCYANWLWSLLLSIYYRYYILFHPPPSIKKMSLIFGIICLPTMFQTYLLFFAYDPPDSLRDTLREKYPVVYSMIAEEDFTNKTVVGANDMIKWPNIYAVSHMTVPIVPCYVIILSFRKRIVDFLENHNEALSREKKAMHSQLLQALTYQAFIPSFYLVAVITFALGMFKIINHPLLEYGTHLCFLVVPCLSPISSLIFVRPYRQVIEDFLSTFSVAVCLSCHRPTTNGKSWKTFSIDSQQPKIEIDDEPDFTNTSCV
ncbi:hypothetical protein WR25_07060 [Diploscapter pachys]|uniref:G-protein coupled receptors family 1 profile domain-containing protein n=1 Tax=Diploscapter pachys TaxID=2018661 RepID=A0A2A2JS61_9BILA|nr:hypothetical protein WR25_07060 [Diploscapter pachys]